MESRSELDSHADSPVVGRNVLIISDSGQRANVTGFTKDLGKCVSVPIVKAALAYTDEYSGTTSILMVNNALHIKSMENNLIPPFMIRLAGAYVDECPKFMCRNPTVRNHAIYFKGDKWDQAELQIPLQLYGTISYFASRIPSRSELEDCPSYDLTPNSPTWNPHEESYASQEHRMLDYRGELARYHRPPERTLFVDQVSTGCYPHQNTAFGTPGVRNVVVSSVLKEVNDMLCCGTFATALRGENLRICSLRSGKRTGATALELASLWKISPEVAKRTLESTTQLCIRTNTKDDLSRRYRTNDRMLRYDRINTIVFMDTFFATKQKGFVSKRGYTCAQLFVTEFNHVHVSPIKGRKEGVYASVKEYFKNKGVPIAIVADGATEQVQGETRKLCNLVGCGIRELEKNTSWANRAELYIGIMKNKVRRMMKQTGTPLRFWCYCIEYMCKINNSIAHEHHQLKGMTPETMLTGKPTDISHLTEYGWYDWVYFWDDAAPYPAPREALGRCLGPADHAGNAMSQWVLNRNGTVLPKQTLRPLTKTERNSEVDKQRMKDFDKAITDKFGDSVSIPDESVMVEEEVEPAYEDQEEVGDVIQNADDIPDYDEYINSEVILPHGEEMQAARVMRRVKDDVGNIIGNYHTNPEMDSRVYEVMFPDGVTQRYSANLIAQNLWDRVDHEGYQHMIMKAIVDHRSDEKAVKKENAYVRDKNNHLQKKKTTIGWHLCVEWRDGTTSWKPLRILKESSPIEVAEYAVRNGIDDEPAFSWWVPYVMQKKNKIIAAVNGRARSTTHKYGIRVPMSISEAYALDRENGNDHWRKAIAKEMKNVSIAFDLKERGETAPPGYIKSTYHMVFDVKMDFTRKARLCHDGHKVPATDTSAYAGVVSRESVRIALTYAALNDLDVCASDILNAYLQAPASEKYYTICGPEFGSENIGKVAIITRALYGGPVSGANFRNHLRDCMSMLGYDSCLADPDVWMRKATKGDGSRYYEYILLYVDDMLSISHEARGAIMEVGDYFTMKPESIGPPDIYLGGKVTKNSMMNGVECYTYSASQYIQNAVKNVEDHLRKKGMALMTRAKSPLSNNYRPELDLSPELGVEEASYYHSLIGMLRWCVELGRIDITAEVSMMASCLAMPREGHLQQVYHIFAYLKGKHNSRIAFDPTYPDIDYKDFEMKEWTNIYGNIKEEIPENAPEPLGKPFIMRAYVDADFAGEKLTRRSRTGYIIFLNMAPIYWYSKKQNCIETSSFGSEFIAMKQCCEYVKGLRYKLRMLGIPVDDPCYVYGDNQSVLANVTIPDSILKKKSNSIAYHYVREGVARREWCMSYINTKCNPADILSKNMRSGRDRDNKIKMIMYDIS